MGYFGEHACGTQRCSCIRIIFIFQTIICSQASPGDFIKRTFFTFLFPLSLSFFFFLSFWTTGFKFLIPNSLFTPQNSFKCTFLLLFFFFGCCSHWTLLPYRGKKGWLLALSPIILFHFFSSYAYHFTTLFFPIPTWYLNYLSLQSSYPILNHLSI